MKNKQSDKKISFTSSFKKKVSEFENLSASKKSDFERVKQHNGYRLKRIQELEKAS